MSAGFYPPDHHQDDDEDVYEIREYIDEDGHEVSNEVFSVKDATRQMEALKLFEQIEKAARESQGKQQQASTSAEEIKIMKEVSPMTKLLDDHDWEGIREKALEIEKSQHLKEIGHTAAEADRQKGRHHLEGSGWGKGFLNNDISHNNNNSTKAAAEAKKEVSSTCSVRQHRQRKHVRWQLSDEQERREEGHNRLQQNNDVDECIKEIEEKESFSSVEQPPLIVEDHPVNKVQGNNKLPVGVSLFKARALGLIPRDGTIDS